METEERGQKLKSVIQFQGQTIRGTDFTAEAALAIHESVKKQPILERSRENIELDTSIQLM